MTDYLNGRVKWFDTKKGYGFLQLCDDESKEYFVHHARITTDLQFATLYDGEYVSFSLLTEGDKTMANDVRGISRGPLLCETRREKKNNRMNYRKSEDTPEPEPEPDTN